MTYVVVSDREFSLDAAKLKDNIFFIMDKEELCCKNLACYQPKYIFFPYWSYHIPKNIYDNYECIIFHMTDVPYGRGGSPLQNLISRGVYETKISAIKCVENFDAGPVYLKRPLQLYGSAEEIFLRASKIIEEMIIYIIENEPQPVPQEGEVVFFERRRPKDGDIGKLKEINRVYDYIRMLDAEGYPPAFLEYGGFKFEFTRASLKKGHLIADVKITKSEDRYE